MNYRQKLYTVIESQYPYSEIKVPPLRCALKKGAIFIFLSPYITIFFEEGIASTSIQCTASWSTDMSALTP